MATTTFASTTYGLKYRGGFRSPMREELSFDIYISERGYSGEVYDLPLTGDCVVITQGAVDDPEIKAFKPSTATLSILCREDSNPYLSLYTLDPTRYKVFIGECRGYSCINRWSGYISTGMYSQPNARAPYAVSIECNDGLEILRNTPYALADGTRYADTLTVRELIIRLLGPIDGGLELWDYMLIEPNQVENTFDIVSLTSAAIYSAVGGQESPSHYEVLEALLQNFGLQLFQRYGSWCVRSLPALASALRPDWYNSAADAFSLNGASILSLYDDEGGREGLSTSANIAMLPPLREINISTEARSDIAIDIYDPKGWRNETVRGPHKISILRGTKGVRFLSLGVVGDGSFPTAFAYYDLPGVATASPNAEIAFSANLYNLDRREIKARVGLLAIEIGLEEVFDARAVINNRIKALGKVAGWNATEQRWDTIPTDSYSSARDLITAITTEITISESKSPTPISQKKSLTLMSSATLSIEAMGYPDIGAAEMRIAVLVAPANQGSSWYVCPFELAEAELSIATASGVAGEEKPRNIKVSHWGSESIEITEAFVSGVADVAGRGIFAPILSRSDSGVPVRSFINPSQRSTATEAIACRLRAMRNDVTIDITGEVYKALPISLNTVWRSREKRFFYPNAITWQLYRGVYDMQLRELLPMRAVPTVNISAAPQAGYCSLDNGIIYRATGSQSIYHLAPISGEEKLILSTAYDTQINEGYLCASVVETVDSETNYYRLYAYDEDGNLLSYVDDLYSAFTAPTTTTATDVAAQMARSARFDAATASWILVCYVPLEGLWAVMLDVGGALLAKKTNNSLLALSETTPLVVFNGGFAVNEVYNDGYRIWWHNSAIHKELEVVLYAEGEERLLAVSDCFTALRSSTNCSIYHRIDNGLGVDAQVFKADTGWSFVAMNNALMLFRNTAGDAMVFDARTGAEIPITANTLAAAYALCGDIVYVFRDPIATIMRGVRVIEGDGYYGAIDADGAELYDVNDLRVMVKKYDI